MITQDIYKTTHLKAANSNRVSFDTESGILTITDSCGKKEIIAPTNDSAAVPCDSKAVSGVHSLFKYMKAMGRSSRLMFGQQNNLTFKAGEHILSHSDTFDVTGTYPSVQAFDVLSFTGVEFNVGRFNNRFTGSVPGWAPLEKISPENGTVSADIDAAVAIAKRAIDLGGIFTLSAHMPNFVFSKERGDYIPGKSPMYAKYNYKEYTPIKLEGNPVQEILSHGKGYEAFTCYLDLIAEFANRLNRPIIFRPYHENTGSWFWWGEKHCTPEEFRELWRITVEYLRDEKGIHNFLYAYSPGSETRTPEEYAVRYPGDEYVDLIGLDMYDGETENGNTEVFFNRFKEQLHKIDEFSKIHHKLAAVTETGLASSHPDPGCHSTAIHLSGNLNLRWHRDILDAASGYRISYFLLWANFSRRGSVYAPYVEGINPDGSLYGHEMLEEFIRYYNDERTIFALQQQEAVKSFL